MCSVWCSMCCLTFIPSSLPSTVSPAFQIQNWFLTTFHHHNAPWNQWSVPHSLPPFFSLSSFPNSCNSTNRLLSSNNSSIINNIHSSSSIILLSSLSPICLPLLSSRSLWVPTMRPHPPQELELVRARWGGHLPWIPHTLTPGNVLCPLNLFVEVKLDCFPSTCQSISLLSIFKHVESFNVMWKWDLN